MSRSPPLVLEGLHPLAGRYKHTARVLHTRTSTLTRARPTCTSFHAQALSRQPHPMHASQPAGACALTAAGLAVRLKPPRAVACELAQLFLEVGESCLDGGLHPPPLIQILVVLEIPPGVARASRLTQPPWTLPLAPVTMNLVRLEILPERWLGPTRLIQPHQTLPPASHPKLCNTGDHPHGVARHRGN